jgi:F0F1-type ATP synthase assembly protein I
MSKKNKKSLRVNRQRNSYIIGISIGVLAGIIFGYATDSIIVSILVCGLLGFGMGHAIYKIIG